MPCFSPLKGYVSLETGGITFKQTKDTGRKMEVPCGQCLGCRLDHSRMWAMRIAHEASLHEYSHGNSFITLTYRDPDACNTKQLKEGYHIPDNWSLDKDHFQRFMKRLRKARPAQTVRFYHCGEYGEHCRHETNILDCQMCGVGRPHYHCILFNCSFTDLAAFGCGPNDIIYYTSAELESIWKYGFVQVGEVNIQTAGYVARYCLKKQTGTAAPDHYKNVNDYGEEIPVLPEYATMSRRPGIGNAWYQKFKTDIYPSDEVPVPGQGVYKKVPRYYDELLRAETPDLLEAIKAERHTWRSENDTEYTAERLMQKYNVKRAQIKSLTREL